MQGIDKASNYVKSVLIDQQVTNQNGNRTILSIDRLKGEGAEKLIDNRIWDKYIIFKNKSTGEEYGRGQLSIDDNEVEDNIEIELPYGLSESYARGVFSSSAADLTANRILKSGNELLPITINGSPVGYGNTVKVTGITIDDNNGLSINGGQTRNGALLSYGTNVKVGTESNSIIYGTGSIGIGKKSQIYGNYSIGIGENNKIETGHNNSFIFGTGLQTGKENQIIFGKYNIQNGYADIIIGSGTDENNKKNSLRFFSNTSQLQLISVDALGYYNGVNGSNVFDDFSRLMFVDANNLRLGGIGIGTGNNGKNFYTKLYTYRYDQSSDSHPYTNLILAAETNSDSNGEHYSYSVYSYNNNKNKVYSATLGNNNHPWSTIYGTNIISTNLLPVSNSSSIGKNDNSWSEAYIQNLSSSFLYPMPFSLSWIGEPGHSWKKAYIDDINSNTISSNSISSKGNFNTSSYYTIGLTEEYGFDFRLSKKNTNGSRHTVSITDGTINYTTIDANGQSSIYSIDLIVLSRMLVEYQQGG